MIATGRGSTKRRRAARPTNALSAAARYEVLERAGEGTLFVVYRVRDRDSGGIRALKALKGAYSRHERFAPALLGLTRQTETLRHPNLALLLQSGREEGTVFLVEDWLPGGSLEARLRRAPIGHIESTLLATQLASGLEYLHQNELTHGDARPRQILFDAEGHARFDDIGFTHAFDAAGMALTDVQLDATLYTAPERFDGQAASPASDLYSLGVVLYRAVTGRVPFDGPSPLSIAMRHRNDRPLRPTQFNPSCTSDLEALILRLMAKEPDARPASATEVLDEIAPHRNRDTIGRNAASTPLRASPAELETHAPQASDVDDAVDTLNTTVVNGSPLSRSRHAVSTPASPIAPDKTVADKIVVEEDEEDFLSEEERTRRARLAKRKHRRREMWGAVLAFFWLAVFCGLLWGVCYGAYMFWMKEAPPEVRVPKYIGMSQRDGEVLLSNQGLQLRVGKEVYNPKKPEGTILGGDPAPGKIVRKGRFILVTVSRGEEPIRMVDFSELTLDQARAIITRHGLRLGQIAEQYHSRVPKGYVCGQYPEAGETFRRSDPINLVVSRGPQPSPVAPSPEELPVSPSPPPAAPNLKADDPSVKIAPQTAPADSEDVLVPRAAVVSVALPAGGGPQEVKILVRDATGDFTAYQQTHEAGDVVEKTLQVVRPQGGTALVRVYVGGKLLREIRI